VPTLALLLAATGACASRSYTTDSAAETSELRIRTGDEIRVVTINRERISFRVEEILDDRFIGVILEPKQKEIGPAGAPVAVSYEDIAMIEVTRFDAAGAGALGVVVFSVALGTLVLTGVPVVIPP